VSLLLAGDVLDDGGSRALKTSAGTGADRGQAGKGGGQPRVEFKDLVRVSSGNESTSQPELEGPLTPWA
jgi:hypothetical protein